MKLFRRLRAVFRKEELDQELSDELTFHLEKQIEQNIAAGMSVEEARYAALRRFGGVEQVKEECRDAWGVRFIDTLLQDIRYGARQLRRNPGFTAVAVIMLGLGIGVTTTIFTAANDFLLRPLPFDNSDRLVMVKRYMEKVPQSGANDPATFKFWREQNHVFEEMAAWNGITTQFNLRGVEGPERVPALQVTGEFFRVLGVKPVLGRTFSPAEDMPGGNRVAVISHSLWQTRYGGTSGILGKTIILDGKDYTLIGVLPASFRFSTTPEEVWTPLALSPASLAEGHGGTYLYVIALLKPGVTLAQAQADMEAITTPWARQFRDWGNGNQRVAVESLRDRYARDLRPALLALLVAAALVLLIACANLANLLLARAASRYKEIAMRRALGASRARIIRQMLSESSVLALLGGSAGLLLAFAGARVFYAALPANWQPLTRGGIDATVLAFALVALLLTVFLIGLAPAWSATGFDLNEGLKEGLRSPLASMSRRSFRAALVVGEVALAAMLLTGTALVMKSFVRLSAVNLGFDSENVLTVDLARTRKGVDAFYREVLERITALPQVRAAGAINFRPLYGPAWGQDITIEGRPPRAPNDSIYAGHRSVSLGYFRAMGIPLLKGRSFVATDEDKRVAVISETMARRYWPGEDPVGKRFGVNCAGGPCNWNSIIGVVGDVKEDGATGEPATAMYFLEMNPKMTLVVRAAQNPTSLIADIRNILHSVDPAQPIGGIHTMENIVSEFVAPRRLTMLISELFAALALLLAMVGLYGVLSYSVAQRSHEFGIRMALGAEKDDILNLIVALGFRLAVAGIILGMAGALALTRVLTSLLFGITPNDPITFGAVALLLVGLALLACYIPARRATKVDPMVALRYE
jgi:putative ABC transport system permease protein